MDEIIDFFAVTAAEFWVGIIVIGFAFFNLLLALRPERIYVDLPRGEFPRHGTNHPTRQVTGAPPPLRSQLPEMSVAEAGLVYRDASAQDLVAATLLDLASRGFLRFVVYHHFSGMAPSYLVTWQREADDTCTPMEHDLLEILATPGAAESPAYYEARPFDVRKYRVTLESGGIAPLGTPTARMSGIRKSLVERLAMTTFHRVHADHGWFRQGRQSVGTAGALEVIGGIAGAVIAGIMALTGTLEPFWVIVCMLVAFLGVVTIIGAVDRTVDGTVARDQARGFREYLSQAPVADGATLEDFVHLAGWAVALDCVHEWAQSLERLSINAEIQVEDVLHWVTDTAKPLSEPHEIEDVVVRIRRLIAADPDADDTGKKTPERTDSVIGW